jgi:hypothetical protein
VTAPKCPAYSKKGALRTNAQAGPIFGLAVCYLLILVGVANMPCIPSLTILRVMQVLLLKCVVAQLHRDLHIRLKVLQGSQEMKGETMDKWRTDLLKETMLWRLFSVSATLGQ